MSTSQLRSLARPFGDADDLDVLVAEAARARIVCIGEASHGTHEFYDVRAAITRRLIAEHGFAAVAVEADWPDADRVNRWVRCRGRDGSADDALTGFRRFPQWMWRNTVVLDFVRWLREHNAARPRERRAGFYGFDLYSLFTSIERVLEYLREVDPEAASRARYRYACFEHYGEDPQHYGYAASFDVSARCEEEVVRQLVELRELAVQQPPEDETDEDDLFSAEQNARLVLNAEQYYRSMFRGRVSSWNLRDSHMADTVEELRRHLGRDGGEPRVVLWAHNSHLGDARATRMGQQGEHNVGQLMRERYGADDCYLIGFTTHHGTVTAADDWDDPARRMRVRPGLAGSWERLFHEVGAERFWLPLRDERVVEALGDPRLERAIGVIYRPQTERLSHYFEADLAAQFDAVLHLDETRALEPLERVPTWKLDEPAETFPSGI
ncbi:MAG TPA: erythromycin esterase family protein [Gemmatimonadaceae bacterium]|nr:erythromycin esterase family protein [Gemmatimonadaceae bacterium]